MKKSLLSTLAIGFGLLSFAQPGSLDPTFADNAEIKHINMVEEASEATTHVLVDPQDRIWIGGYTYVDSDYKLILARLDANGSYDLTFHETGYVVINVGANDFEEIQGMVWQNGKLLIAVNFTTNNITGTFVMRYTEEGVIDTDFGQFGLATVPFNMATTDMKLDNENNIYLSGDQSGNITMAKLTPDGIPDESFHEDGFREMAYASTDRSASFSVTETGEIYIFGYTTLLGITSGLIHSLNPDGTNNTGWSVTGRLIYTWPNDLDFYVSDGIMSIEESCFYLAGNTSANDQNAAVISVDLEGNLRNTFANNGRWSFDPTLGLNEMINEILITPEGLYLAMNIDGPLDGIDAVVTHLSHQGVLVQGFGNQGMKNYNLAAEGADDMALAMAAQSSGQLILTGITVDLELSSFVGYAVRINTAETSNVQEFAFKQAKIYPNPAVNSIRIELETTSQNEQIRIFNTMGQLVHSGLLQDPGQNIEISHLTPGQYQVIIGEHSFGRFTRLK